MNTKHSLSSIGKLFLLTGLLVSLSSPAGAQEKKDAIPVREQVGAQALPPEIAPIVAPFDMPQLARPQFGDYSLSITKTGAKEGKMATRSSCRPACGTPDASN